MSAIQLAQIMGAREVFAVDIDSNKLQLAHDLGAQPVDGRDDPALAIKDATSGRGVDVALELIGTKQTCELAVALLAPKGRAAIAGLLSESMAVRPYPDIINREVEIVGVSDHLLAELEVILDWASTGELDLNPLVSATVPLAASPINRVLDELEAGTSTIRTVIEPAT
jgi:threonine dehydrogenase-like Zn-dependent dehydrogenase